MIRIPVNRIESTNIDLADISCSQCNFLLLQSFVQCTICKIKYCEDCNLKIIEDKKSCMKCSAGKDLIKEGNSDLELDQIKIKCANFTHGCKIVYSYNTLTDLDKHQAKCDYKMVKCKACKKVEFLQKDTNQHEEICPEILISCANCNSLFERKNMEKHQKIECLLILSSCKFCEKGIPFVFLKDHLIGCKPVRIKCQICGFDRLKNHDCTIGLLNKIWKFQRNNELWMKDRSKDKELIIRESLSQIKLQINPLISEITALKQNISQEFENHKNEFHDMIKNSQTQLFEIRKEVSVINTQVNKISNELIDQKEQNKEYLSNVTIEMLKLNSQVDDIKNELDGQKKGTEDHLIKIQVGMAEFNSQANDIKNELVDLNRNNGYQFFETQKVLTENNTEFNNIKKDTSNICTAISLLNEEILQSLTNEIEEVKRILKKNFEDTSLINVLTLLGVDKSSNSDVKIGIQKYINNRSLDNSLNMLNNENIIIEKIKNSGQVSISNFISSQIENFFKSSELSIIDNELIPKATSILKDISFLSEKIVKNPLNISFTSTKSAFISYLTNWNSKFASNYIFNEEGFYTIDQLEKNQYLYYVEFQESSKKLFLHMRNLKSINDPIIKKVLYNHDSTSIYFDGISHKAKYFCCGGIFNGEYLNICSIFSLENQTLDNSIKLNEQKSDVSLVSTTNYIWCLGGLIKNGNTKICEYFDNFNNLWKVGPPLNNSAYGISSFFFSPQEIYVLGNSIMSSYFEKLNITSLSNSWKLIKISPKFPRKYGCTFQLNNLELLLFGGDGFYEEFSIFNTKNSTLIPLSNKFSKLNNTFNSTRPIYFDHCIYLIIKEGKQLLQINPITLYSKESTLNF